MVDEVMDAAEPAWRQCRHPLHDEVAAEVRSWYTTSVPEAGYEVSRQWYGYHSDLGPTRARVILRVDQPHQVPAALADARAASGTGALTIWVEDRRRADRLGEALRLAGCQPGEAITYLALVGPMTGGTGPEHLVIQSIGDARLEEWATVKLQSFGDTESAPAPERLAEEVASRKGELALTGYRVGLLDGEIVSVLAYYRGSDQLVFNLGTRVPYRHRGIAQAMLADWVQAGTASGSRSLIINAAEGGRPAELYRRLGFVDEIYWNRRYELAL